MTESSRRPKQWPANGGLRCTESWLRGVVHKTFWHAKRACSYADAPRPANRLSLGLGHAFVGAVPRIWSRLEFWRVSLPFQYLNLRRADVVGATTFDNLLVRIGKACTSCAAGVRWPAYVNSRLSSQGCSSYFISSLRRLTPRRQMLPILHSTAVSPKI